MNGSVPPLVREAEFHRQSRTERQVGAYSTSLRSCRFIFSTDFCGSIEVFAPGSLRRLNDRQDAVRARFSTALQIEGEEAGDLLIATVIR